jgi:hypothetical protein
MSVNIFGSSGTFSHGVNSGYVDQKFTTLSTNLTSKVNKSGDIISGDLKLLLGDDALRTFGVSDLRSGKSMSLLLGNEDNQIRHNFGHPLKIAALHGIKFTCPMGDICKMGAENDPRIHVYQDIVMSNKFIAGLRDPFSAQDAATKNYTDKNDNLRVLKSGDTMTGDLYFDAITRNVEIGCKNLGSAQYFRLYLGSEACKINSYNNDVSLFAANSLSVSVGANINILSINVAEVVLTKPLSMTNDKITNLATPTDPTDAVTKQYVDTKFVKNNVGYVPNLESNISLTGFIASCSDQMGPGFQAYEAFNNLKSDNSWATMNTAGWLQIQCPDQVRIWRVALKARSFVGKNLTSWSLTASNDGLTFETLLTPTSTLLGAATKPSFFEIDTLTAYQYYRFNISMSEGAPGTGVQYMQLYTVDELTS